MMVREERAKGESGQGWELQNMLRRRAVWENRLISLGVCTKTDCCRDPARTDCAEHRCIGLEKTELRPDALGTFFSSPISDSISWGCKCQSVVIFFEDLAICKLKCISERNESVCMCSSHTEILRVPCFPKAAWDLALWEATRAASHLQGLAARVATGEDTFNCLKERIQPHHSANSPCQLFHGQTMLWKKSPSPALEGKCNASCQVDGKRIMQLAQTLHFW